MSDSNDCFFAVVSDQSGKIVSLIPGMEALKYTRSTVTKIKYSDEFIAAVAPSISSNPDRFLGEFEYDVYPLLVFWNRIGLTSGLVTVCQHNIQLGERGPIEPPMALTYLAETIDVIDKGTENVIKGMSDIVDVKSILAPLSMRPLSFSVLPGSADDELLLAAMQSFAAAYFFR
jgi:hypothetical protein